MSTREHVTAHSSLKDFTAEEWNALLPPHEDFIFARYEFLAALEDSGCLGRRTGWYPHYLALREGSDLIGVVPLYVKSNSYGEYIFDWAWANAAEGAGLRYYPKLTAAIPFTPATGPKFLVRDSRALAPLMAAARDERERLQASSIHWLFCTASEAEALRAEGFAIRSSYQFHWRNRGWKTFADFLGDLRSKRRNEIRREREAVARLGLRIEVLTGEALTPELASTMFQFYESTMEKKRGGFGYLNEEFFQLLFARLSAHVLLVAAFDADGHPVAGALNLFSGRTLYGRYWGCLADYRNLHFELCYYQTVEWAIAHGIELFEAGAQGEQKFSRGFTPSWCYSAHELTPPGLDHAVREFILEEHEGLTELFAEYKSHDPYKAESAPKVPGTLAQ